MRFLFASVVTLLAGVCQAQHVGHVGPTVPATSKMYECNVLNYGAKADNATDIGPAIKSAFTNCVVKNPNSRLIVPAASNCMKVFNWAFQLDGLITVDYSAYVKGTVAGNALVFQRMNEFELYSSNGKGAIAPLPTASSRILTRALLFQRQGNYLLSTTVLLNGASNWAFQLDGLITVDYSAYVKGTVAGNALVFQRMNEFELYSSNGKGAIQGQGYLYRLRPNQDGRSGWPRLLRVHISSNFSVHDIKLVDAPSFHMVVGEAVNAEIYRITIRGGNQGGLDGVDISGTNYHVHHVEVTNRDECVCVKSPSKQATIENIRCNQSGGTTIGSLKDGSVIENILFQNIENYQVTNAFMLKTYPGGASPGYVKNVVLRNFTNIDVTYNAYITQYWQNSYAAGASNVQLSNITFSDWRGSVNHGGNRGAVVTSAYVSRSGGTTIGSLKDGSVIENILFQNIENYQVTNAFMLKTYPGGASPGYVKNVVLRNFTNIDVTYNAYITQYWQNSYAAGASNVQLSNITFSDWRGSVNHGGNRGAVVVVGSETNPPVNVNVKNFSFWTINGNKVVDRCDSTYGGGSCIKALSSKATPTRYAAVSATATAAPAGWVQPSAPWGIPAYDLYKPIPVPTSTFY
ncbi:unnamed protein product [Rhizoctonia solani]|uniref:Uncharacterized protein n=1 Tax=Rhizoctonia solani TaxID=456999 RepID=A0A8H3H282_9AGAM|nr:unnamed protein product [Rhizoctonia solani]